MRFLRKGLIWTHRYLGMLLSLFFLMWFVTGIGMIFSRGMPRLSPDVRLARLAPLDLNNVRLTAAEAAEIAGLNSGEGSVVLLTVLDRPAYRFGGRTPAIVFADTGELHVTDGLGGSRDAEVARQTATAFIGLPDEKVHYAGLVTEPDQWTMTLTRQLPLHKFSVDDGAGTELYVSSEIAEVVQITTRASRALAWVSTIPHFMYFAPLRLNGELWNNIMVWSAGLGCILAVVGIILGVMHFKPSRPFRLSRLPSYIPYTGWMRWHYVSGLVFGVLTLTWVFSGLLSMEPFAWSTRDESLAAETTAAFPSGAGNLSDYPVIDAEGWRQVLGDQQIKEVELVRIFEEPHFVVRNAPHMEARPGRPDGGHQPYFVQRGYDPERVVLSAQPLAVREPFSAETITASLERVSPGTPVLETAWLDSYDTYYYSRDNQAPLPVLRIKVDDPDATWLYVDPQVAQVTARINRINRVERWLYNGLHSLDFAFLYSNSRVWAALVIVLSIGGAIVSGLGVMLGARRLLRAAYAAILMKN